MPDIVLPLTSLINLLLYKLFASALDIRGTTSLGNIFVGWLGFIFQQNMPKRMCKTSRSNGVDGVESESQGKHWLSHSATKTNEPLPFAFAGKLRLEFTVDYIHSYIHNTS